MTEAFAALNAEEQKTLLKILHKLRQSLTQQVGQYDLGSYKTSLE
jgi:hypothetical protein